MASEIEETEVRSGSGGSAAELRRLAELESRLADASDLPMVREKHRLAAQKWSQMAADRERLELNAARRTATHEQRP